MEINWMILVLVGIGILALLFFLIRQNQKDEKKFERELNRVKKPTESEIDDSDDDL